MIKQALLGLPFATETDMENYVRLLKIAKDVEGYGGRIPLFVITSNGQGCGKTELAKTALHIGGNRGLMVLPRSEEAVMSMMISIVDSNRHVYCFDNVKGVVDSNALSSVVSGELTYRLLGKNTYETKAVKKLFILNGNDVKLSDDLERRAVRICMDKKKIGIGFGFSMNDIAEAVNEIP